MKNTNKIEKLLNPDEVAAMLGLKKNTLAVWKCNRKNLPVIKIGRLIRYRLSDIENFIKNNVCKPRNRRAKNKELEESK